MSQNKKKQSLQQKVEGLIRENKTLRKKLSKLRNAEVNTEKEVQTKKKKILDRK